MAVQYDLEGQKKAYIFDVAVGRTVADIVIGSN